MERLNKFLWGIIALLSIPVFIWVWLDEGWVEGKAWVWLITTFAGWFFYNRWKLPLRKKGQVR